MEKQMQLENIVWYKNFQTCFSGLFKSDNSSKLYIWKIENGEKTRYEKSGAFTSDDTVETAWIISDKIISNVVGWYKEYNELVLHLKKRRSSKYNSKYQCHEYVNLKIQCG